MAMRVQKWRVLCKWPHGGITSASFDSEDEAHDDAVGAALEAAAMGYPGAVFEVVSPAGEVVSTIEGGMSSDDDEELLL